MTGLLYKITKSKQHQQQQWEQCNNHNDGWHWEGFMQSINQIFSMDKTTWFDDVQKESTLTNYNLLVSQDMNWIFLYSTKYFLHIGSVAWLYNFHCEIKETNPW